LAVEKKQQFLNQRLLKFLAPLALLAILVFPVFPVFLAIPAILVTRATFSY
jgi:hypothetical protein